MRTPADSWGIGPYARSQGGRRISVQWLIGGSLSGARACRRAPRAGGCVASRQRAGRRTPGRRRAERLRVLVASAAGNWNSSGWREARARCRRIARPDALRSGEVDAEDAACVRSRDDTQRRPVGQGNSLRPTRGLGIYRSFLGEPAEAELPPCEFGAPPISRSSV